MKNTRMLSPQCNFVSRITLVLIMCVPLAVSQESRSSPASLGNDAEQMTPVQLRALPDSAMLRYKGQSLTKSAFIEQRLKEFQLKAESLSPKGALSFETLKAQFQQKQTAALAEKNARVEAVIGNLNRQKKQIESSPAFSALAKESAEILGRYPGSSPAQQLQFRQRAMEIHNQLLRMEKQTTSSESN
jgi:hypothetical protein